VSEGATRDPSCTAALLRGSAIGSVSSAPVRSRVFGFLMRQGERPFFTCPHFFSQRRQARAFTRVLTPQGQALAVRPGSLGVSCACFDFSLKVSIFVWISVCIVAGTRLGLILEPPG
jgi:hypothetical protein